MLPLMRIVLIRVQVSAITRQEGLVIVCVCHNVSDRQVVRAAQCGAGLADLRRELGLGTSCGKCACQTRQILRAHEPARDATPPLMTMPLAA